jgi:hypothetical protein
LPWQETRSEYVFVKRKKKKQKSTNSSRCYKADSSYFYSHGTKITATMQQINSSLVQEDKNRINIVFKQSEFFTFFFN